jgi:hypothetical protein
MVTGMQTVTAEHTVLPTRLGLIIDQPGGYPVVLPASLGRPDRSRQMQ